MRNLLLAMILFSFIGCQDKTEQAEPTRDTVLIDKAKKESLSRLKSPSTAKFIDSLHTVMQLKVKDGPSDSYRVTISVDAQNSFGATMRERYMVIYQDQGGDSLNTENYKLDQFYN